ncbi:MAG: hypothetical protein EU536_03475 [Promethearchaeota archaeon]|nr:MAG: hypothetical protein EU536_03475 [Candidatus Lokiarchaeota archaeon]
MNGASLTKVEQKVFELVNQLNKQGQKIRIKDLFALAKRKLKFPQLEIERAIWSLIQKKYIVDGKKLTKATVLTNKNRQEMLQYLYNNPGTHIRAVREKMNMGSYLTSWHIMILEKFGYIRKKQHKNMVLLFPALIQEGDEELFTVLKDEKVFEINEYLFENKSITLQNVQTKFKLAKNDAQSYLDVLQSVELVGFKDENGERVYYGNSERLQSFIEYWKIKDQDLKKMIPEPVPSTPPIVQTPIAFEPLEERPVVPVEVKREYDYLGGNIRFKIAVRNNSETMISKIRVMLTPTDQFKFESEVKSVETLGPGESRGVDFLLTPMTCGKSQVFGTVSYVNAFGKPNSLTVDPKEIWVKCPLVTSIKAELKDLLEWQASLQSGMSSLPYEGLTKDQAFEIVTNQISALDLAVVTLDSTQLKATYSGIAKVTNTKMIVEVETYEGTSKLVVWASSLNQVTGFLAYIKNLVIVALDMAKSMRMKGEKFSQQILSAFELADRLSQLFEYCEMNWNLSEVIILLKEILTRAHRDLPSLPFEMGHWVADLEQELDPNATIWEQTAINLEFEMYNNLVKVGDVIRSNLEMYKGTFQDDLDTIKSIEEKYQQLLLKTAELEQKYSTRILVYLLIIESNSGVTLYEHNFAQKTLDPDLISGFLTAVQSFGVELTSDQEAGMKKLAYKNFEIELNVGDYIRAALFLTGENTKFLIKKQTELINQFEERYSDKLKEWHGDVSVFSSAKELIETVFKS